MYMQEGSGAVTCVVMGEKGGDSEGQTQIMPGMTTTLGGQVLAL